MTVASECQQVDCIVQELDLGTITPQEAWDKLWALKGFKTTTAHKHWTEALGHVGAIVRKGD